MSYRIHEPGTTVPGLLSPERNRAALCRLVPARGCVRDPAREPGGPDPAGAGIRGAAGCLSQGYRADAETAAASCAPGRGEASFRADWRRVVTGAATWDDRAAMPKQVSNVATDDYLTAIYRLSHDEGLDVIAVRLADRLEITPPSVAGMLKRLIRDGLVSIDAKKNIHLTVEGLRRAEEMVRRHRLAECLITDVLKVPWWRAYEEAHLLEHGISDVTEPHLYESLGRPQRSPFGYPIPGRSPNRKLPMTTLADIREGQTAEIDRVFEEDEQLLQFFHDEGILPGRKVLVETQAPYRGTITAVVNERPVVMGMQVAQRIWVVAPK